MFGEECNRLFYVDEGQGGLNFKRMVMKEEEKVHFQRVPFFGICWQ